MMREIQTIRRKYGIGFVPAIRVYLDRDVRSFELGERTNSDSPKYRTLVGGPSRELNDSSVVKRRYFKFLKLSGMDREALKEMRELDERLESIKRRRGGGYLPQSKEEGEAMLKLFMSTSRPYDCRDRGLLN